MLEALLDPLLAVLLMAACLFLAFAALGACAWLIDGHHPRHLSRVRNRRRE